MTAPGRRQGGGRGYYRTASLVSIWATAPLLHNNSVGTFVGDPSVKGRIAAFNDAIRKLLWPAHATDRSIKRVSTRTYLNSGSLPLATRRSRNSAPSSRNCPSGQASPS